MSQCTIILMTTVVSDLNFYGLRSDVRPSHFHQPKNHKCPVSWNVKNHSYKIPKVQNTILILYVSPNVQHFCSWANKHAPQSNNSDECERLHKKNQNKKNDDTQTHRENKISRTEIKVCNKTEKMKSSNYSPPKKKTRKQWPTKKARETSTCVCVI